MDPAHAFISDFGVPRSSCRLAALILRVLCPYIVWSKEGSLILVQAMRRPAAALL
ncbi:hypothetical protein FOMPIDRAFT_1026119 [Fomitopsis schrenkii]|uniref:Uncharacterized protein n=1 Tax=Fomitopsis schrenkii TaxID=2126942 RepID=S8DTX2_FOMSC|nr:hypothetical protein FOMPIDRAFT_1026119 [Fomitopsis schrenkii]